MIPTVLGPVEANDVEGKCSPHEHLLAKPSGMTAAMLAKVHGEPITLSNLPEVRRHPEGSHVSDRLLSLDESVQELADLVHVGGAKGLVLDCTSVGQGRSAAGLVEVGRRSGMHVVMAASWVSTVSTAVNVHFCSKHSLRRPKGQQLAGCLCGTVLFVGGNDLFKGVSVRQLQNRDGVNTTNADSKRHFFRRQSNTKCNLEVGLAESPCGVAANVLFLFHARGVAVWPLSNCSSILLHPEGPLREMATAVVWQ